MSQSAAPRILWGLLIIVLLGVVATWAGTRWLWPELAPRAAATQLPSYGAVAEFSLTDQFGRPFGRKDLVGRIWVANFIFTRCSGPCPVLSHNLAGLIDSLGAEVPARFVSFTVDPEHDTPEIMKAYAERHGADHDRWRFLTGPRSAISDLSIQSFHMAMGDPELVTVARPIGSRHRGAGEGDSTTLDTLAGAPVDSMEIMDIPHSVRLVLVDENGEIRGYYDGTELEAVGRLRQDLLRLARTGA